MISVDAGESEGLLAHIPAERMAARAKAEQPWGSDSQEGRSPGEPRQWSLPTADLAKRYEVPRQELAKIFWSG